MTTATSQVQAILNRCDLLVLGAMLAETHDGPLDKFIRVQVLAAMHPTYDRDRVSVDESHGLLEDI
ncbi:hypothetical protein LCGC14_1528660 [marine sediment metagenome]|uniref:Uncharacterized protein n=1 Tax=marine sediment metagenome TaxID=412755 RepID=A0A0F9LXD1_9ZZZZ